MLCEVYSLYGDFFLILNTTLQLKSVQFIHTSCESKNTKFLNNLSMYFHHFYHFLARGCNGFPGMPSVYQKVEHLYPELLPDGLLLPGTGAKGSNP